MVEHIHRNDFLSFAWCAISEHKMAYYSHKSKEYSAMPEADLQNSCHLAVVVEDYKKMS